jgi:amidase
LDDVAFEPALELARRIRERDLSPVDVVELYLARIDKLDSTLNAFVTVAADSAMDEARRAEASIAAGDDLAPFHGVPIALKDNVPTAGIRTTYSCRNFADNVPEEDSAVARRVKEAGFIVLGKTNMSEFGTFPVTESELNGACRNPWNTDLTPGGSSGGAAAGVASGMTPIAQGTDGGGSVRIPSSCCGLFGIKPSRGRVSFAPTLGEFWAGADVVGPIARSVADAAALLDVMSGYEPGDPYSAAPFERPLQEESRLEPGRLRVGVTTSNPTGVSVDQVAIDAVEATSSLLEEAGHEVEEVSFDWLDGDEVTSHFIKLVQTSSAHYDDIDPEKLEPANRALMEAGKETDSLTYVRAVRGLHDISRRVARHTAGYDVLLTPTLPVPPVPIGYMFEEDDPWVQLFRAGEFIAFTALANFTGLPAVSVPMHWSDDGLPIGVQMGGRPGAEATLVRVAAQLEKSRPWADRRPPVS